MLTVIYAECQIKAPFMLSVVMLSAIMLSVVMLSVVMLSVIMLNVVMLNVVAPWFCSCYFVTFFGLKRGKTELRNFVTDIFSNVEFI
jgi:hypothetical protein